MKLSIRQIFFNLKIALVILGLGTTLLCIQMINISQYSDRLAALKNQHVLIKKITATNLKDSDMANIAINGDLAELKLFAKLSNKGALLDLIIASTTEQESLGRSLISTSNAFQEAALFWAESMVVSRDAMHERMISARNLYLIDIDVMIDYQIQLINESISVAKITVLILFFFGLFTYFFYRWRLNQIYRDINAACSVDTDGNKPDISTEEVDFIVRRLSRKMPMINTNPTMLNPQSGLNNEKGILTLHSAKRHAKATGTIFVVVYEIDKHDELESRLSKEEMGGIYKKLAEILSMYEQPHDIIGQLENNAFAFIMTRSSKDQALSDAEKVVASIHDSIFQTLQGSIKITVSGGLLLKAPSKSLEVSFVDAGKILLKAKETGGNRVAQLRESADMYR
jgi:GGDEF domain-containing protein